MKPNVSRSGRIQALFLILFILAPSVAWSAVQSADSCSYADVSSAIQAASSGDLVMVPSGSCTWSSELLVDKGIILQGAGVGFTTIIGNIGSSDYIVIYEPSDP